ncbi:MAG: CAP domain-containing protein [Patescibacteria group bacterium]|nr:CAP domain-containing protein [Patescibacteria group bacterium]
MSTPSPARPSEKHWILLLFLALLLSGKLLIAAFAPQPRLLASDLTIANIISAINEQRSSHNLTVLNSNIMLSSAAQSKADDMQTRHYFSHVDPDGNYIWPKIVATGYTPYLQLGENLAIEFYDTQSLVSAWMNSPTHRANILNEGFVDQGMGLNFGDSSVGQYHSVVVNTFGALLIKKAAAAPAPAPSPTQTPAPAPAAPKPAPAPIPEPTPVATTTATAPVNTILPPIALRGSNTEQSLVIGGQQTSTTPASVTPPSQKTFSPETIIDQNSARNQGPSTMRYFTLALGLALLLFLFVDLQKAMERQLAHLDKKVNNIVLVIITLIVVAVMYWL